MSSSSAASSPFDASFQSVYSACTAEGLGGELKFVDAFFAFLRKQTKLLQAPSAVEQVQQIALKHVELAKKEAKAAANAAAAKAKADAAAAKAASAPAPAAAAASSSSSSSAPDAANATTLEDAPEAAEDAEDKLPAPVGNGGTTAKYSWTQTLAEVSVVIPLPAGTGSKQLSVVIEPTKLHVGLKGAAAGSDGVFVSGEPDERIDSSDATWTLETDSKTGGKVLELFLPKANKMSWWKCVVKGDPAINTKKIVPENSKLEDLDGDTRSTVEKMMFDQRQKQMGKPSSDEMTKQAALKRFMEQHPEMDFSNAKVSDTKHNKHG